MFESEVNNICYSDCDKQGHQSQPLSRICVDEQCKHPNIICSMCQRIDHYGHKSVPLKVLFNKVINECGFSKAGTNPFFFTAVVDQSRNRFLMNMKSTRNQIIDLLDEIEVKGKMYFNKLEQSIMSLLQIHNPINYLCGDTPTNSQRLRDYFGKVLKLIKFDQKKVFSLDNKLKQLIEDCKKKSNQIEKGIKSLFKTMQKTSNDFHNILSQEPQSLQMKAHQFHWSNQLKGSNIKINDKFAQQEGSQSAGERFAILQPSLVGNNRYTWGIKVKKLSTWIGVGICLKNIIKKVNYHFNYTHIGHGSYLISSNGYTWSHSNKDFNSQLKTFTFTVKDIVYLQYDPKQNKIHFMKNKTQQKFQLSFIPPPNGDVYNACVNLCGNGDAVQIIYPGIPII